MPLATSSKLATAQGSTLVNYGKIQLFLLPTRTMEQNKTLNKPFKQIFHFTDIKHNIIGISFVSKYIPTINILNSKILIKDKYTKTRNTALTFFQRINKQPPFFSKVYPIYNQQQKHLKPLSGNIYNFSLNKFTSMIKVKINNNFLCQISILTCLQIFQNLDLIYQIFEKHEFRHYFVTRI